MSPTGTEVAHRTTAAATIRPMTNDEFESWQAALIRDVAAEISRASGLSMSAALTRSRQQFDDLLPNGRETAGNWLMRVMDEDGDAIGMLWIGPHAELPAAAYIYHLHVEESARGRGFGRRAMLAAERLASEAGIAEIALNVFGCNDQARTLYDSMGYRVLTMQLSKTLR